MKFAFIASLLLATVLSPSSLVQAVIIEFDAGPTGPLASYEEGGFILEPMPAAFFIVNAGSGGNPSPRLDSDAFQIRAIDSEPFDLLSLDLAFGDSLDDWQAEGFFAVGGSITKVITPEGGFTTETFTGFVDLNRVEVTPLGSGGLRWDNIAVQIVPEPVTLGLLMCTLAHFISRRQSKKVLT